MGMTPGTLPESRKNSYNRKSRFKRKGRHGNPMHGNMNPAYDSPIFKIFQDEVTGRDV